MNRLWVRLSVAFAVVTLVAVALVAALANLQAKGEVRTFLTQQQVLDSGLVAALDRYYSDHGGWSGVATVFASFHSGGNSSAGAGNSWGLKTATFTLADAQGVVVYDESGQYFTSAGQATGRQGQGPAHGVSAATSASVRLTAQDQAAATPISSGQSPTGYLVVRLPSGSTLPAPAQALLDQINSSLVRAGLLAGILGVLLGVGIAHTLASPLRRLAHATQRVAAGKLDQRVPITGPHEVRRLAVAFNDMADRLQQSEQSRQRMVADIAHELRTPLSVLQGNLRAILDDVYPLEKAEIATIYDETLLLSRLVGDLHDLTLAEADRLHLNPRPLALAPLVERAVALYQELAGASGVSLTATLPERPPTVLADAERTGQVLHNLLANALRHTPEGGRITVQVDLVATAEGLREPARGPGEDGWVRVSVSDTGPGLAPTEVPHVFDRFWRADPSRSRSRGGSGLGLAIARALVEGQRGRIGVESAPGKGSRFWFTLPIAPQQTPPS